MRPIVLSIAGSDSSAGAGVQADLKTIEANGAYAATVITAITAQNTRQVSRVGVVDADLVAAQLEAVFDDLRIAAVKSGMLGNASVARVVARTLAARRPPCYVCDPVMVSGTGARLLTDEAIRVVREELLPLATLVTPNVPEAAALSGLEVADLPAAERAGRRLVEAGAAAVLVKGGHLRDELATDVLVTAAGVELLRGEPVRSRHTHGTGCALSAAIAARLARGDDLLQAVREAKRFVTEAIRHGLAVGHGDGPTDPLWAWHARDAGARAVEGKRR